MSKATPSKFAAKLKDSGKSNWREAVKAENRGFEFTGPPGKYVAEVSITVDEEARDKGLRADAIFKFLCMFKLTPDGERLASELYDQRQSTDVFFDLEAEEEKVQQSEQRLNINLKACGVPEDKLKDLTKVVAICGIVNKQKPLVVVSVTRKTAKAGKREGQEVTYVNLVSPYTGEADTSPELDENELTGQEDTSEGGVYSTDPVEHNGSTYSVGDLHSLLLDPEEGTYLEETNVKILSFDTTEDPVMVNIQRVDDGSEMAVPFENLDEPWDE